MNQGKLSLVVSLGVLLADASFSSVIGATIRDDTPDADYRALGGSPDYASVGKLVNSWGYNGSATLIAPDWILTAAHSLVAADSVTFTLNGVDYTSSQLFLHPSWQNGNPLGGYDFGLVRLSAPVAGIVPSSLYLESAELGQTGTFVGYGLTGTGLTGYRSLDNQKRAFQNTIDGDLGNPSLVLGADFDNPRNAADSAFGSSDPLALEGAVAPGDSGGGVFITVDSQVYLAGVISFIADKDGRSNSDYGDISGFGRVSMAYPWIATVVPEPSTNALLALSALGLLAKWTRRKRA
jgi:Trypsin/PEP-CTERM motif